MRKPTKDYLYADEIADQDDAVPFLGDLYSSTDEEFFPIEKKKLFVKSLNVTDDNFTGEVILGDIDCSETPKKFDKVVVSVEVSIPRAGKGALLGSWTLVETHGKFRDEFNKDVSTANIRVTYYYFQSLKRLTGLQAASRYKNIRTECRFEQSLEELTDSVKLTRSLYKDIMPQLDREQLEKILDDSKQLSVELNVLVQDWIKKLTSDNWVRFTCFLVRQFDLIGDFIKSPDNDIALIEKTYKEKRSLIDLLQKESIEYVNSKEKWLSIVADYAEIYALMFYDKLLQTNVDVIIFYREFIKSRKWKNVLFCAVDLDLVDHSAFETPPAEQIQIRKFFRGRCEISDLMASERTDNGNVAIHDGEWQKIVPKTRALLKAICPGFYSKRSCQNAIKSWLCVMCKQPLYYVFEWGIFCDQCGAGLVEDFSFRCDNIEHIYPIPLTREQCRELNVLVPMTEINILLLGPSNVDKLPWINSMRKYMSLKFLESLDVKEIKELIPSKFVIADSKMQLRTVHMPVDANENPTSVASTEECKKYSFVQNNVLYNLIDTPALCRSDEQDTKTIKKVLHHVRNIDVLHGISIFFTSMEQSLPPRMSLCLKEILSNMHPTAARNLTFCCTDARRVNDYHISLRIVSKFFSDIQVEVNFELESRIFFFDDSWSENVYNTDLYAEIHRLGPNDVEFLNEKRTYRQAASLLQTVSTFDALFSNYAH